MSAHDDMKEFFDNSPDRGLAIALPAILENRVTTMLKLAMRRDEKTEKELFRSSGALANFGVKAQLAYMLGLLDKETYRDLDLLVKIRNDFAHNVGTKRFDQETISRRIESMHIYKILVSLRDGRPFDPKRDEPFTEKVKAQILRDEMETMRGSFRMCVRMLIYHLKKLEEVVRKTVRS